MEKTPLQIWRSDRKAAEVAQKLGVTLAMWSRWENGKRSIPANRVNDISELTGIPPHELRPDVFRAPQAEDAA